MDRNEAEQLAQHELNEVTEAGYGAAAEHIDTVLQKHLTAASGAGYDIEISYLWDDEERENILVICRVRGKNLFGHEHLELSVTLGPK